MANDNGFRSNRQDQPDLIYAFGYIRKMMAHFRDCKIEPSFVAAALTDALIDNAPGDPFLSNAYEGDILHGLSCLEPAIHFLKKRVIFYEKALAGIHEQRAKVDLCKT